MELQEAAGKLQKMEEELADLTASFTDWAETYQGNDFPEQMELAVCLENIVQSLTHETAEEMGFMRCHMGRVARFIEFRQQWRQCSDEDLSVILDSEMIPVRAKREINLRLGDPGGTALKELKAQWQNLFPNQSYGKVSRQCGDKV